MEDEEENQKEVWPTYHIFDTVENPFSFQRQNDLKKCCFGQGFLFFVDEEHRLLYLQNTQDEDEEPKEIGRFDQNQDLIAMFATSVGPKPIENSDQKNEQQTEPMVFIATADSTGNKDIFIYIYDLAQQKTKQEPLFKISLQSLNIQIDINNNNLPPFSISPSLERFCVYDADEIYIFQRNRSIQSRKKKGFQEYIFLKKDSRQTCSIKKEREIITNVILLDNEMQGIASCNTWVVTQTTISFYDRKLNQKTGLDVGAESKFSCLVKNPNNEDLLCLCRPDNSKKDQYVLTFYDPQQQNSLAVNFYHEETLDDDIYDIDEEDDSVDPQQKTDSRTQLIEQVKRKKLKLALEDKPRSIHWCKNVLVVVYDKYMGRKEGSIRLYNLEPRCVFGKANDGESVVDIFYEWNSIIIIRNTTSDLYRTCITKLQEVDIDDKIEQVMKNEQFGVALAIAKSHGLDVRQIHQKRGDSYLAKMKYKKAINAYKLTIGWLEPSYVITRFIDPQRAEELISYLQELNQKSVTNSQYTTLLFNCYTKLHNFESLQKMINDGIFDVPTAINVLRLGGLSDYALQLAEQKKMHFMWATIKAEEQKYQDILDYIIKNDQPAKIGVKDFTDIVTHFGLEMLDDFIKNGTSEFFVNALANACIDGVEDEFNPSEQETPQKEKANPDDFIPIFAHHPAALKSFLNIIIGLNNGEVSAHIRNTAIEAGLLSSEKTQKDGKSEKDEFFDKLFTEPDKAGDAFDINTEQLMLFLRSLPQDESKASLIKLYMSDRLKFYEEALKLYDVKEIPKLFSKDQNNNKIWRTHNSLWRFALSHLISLSIDARKKPDKQNELETIQKAISEMVQNINEVREDAEKQAQEYIYAKNIKDIQQKRAESEKKAAYSFSDSTSQNSSVPDSIDGPVPFLDVLDIVSKDKKLQFKVIKDFAITEFKKRQERIQKLTELCDREEEDMIKNDTITRQLKTCHYQSKQTRCSRFDCKGVLELPVKHFLCGHSFHMEHLGENINICIVCQNEQKKIIEKKRDSLKEALEQYKSPIDLLDSSNLDPICTFSSMLQSGVMDSNDPNEELKSVEKLLSQYPD